MLLKHFSISDQWLGKSMAGKINGFKTVFYSWIKNYFIFYTTFTYYHLIQFSIYWKYFLNCVLPRYYILGDATRAWPEEVIEELDTDSKVFLSLIDDEKIKEPKWWPKWSYAIRNK